MKGSTDKWPKFQNLTLDTMFSVDLTKSEIYAIYDDSSRFHVYDFKDMSEPKIVKSGITSINQHGPNQTFLWFIDNPDGGGGSKKSLKSLMKVKTSISYKKTLILMSNQYYCKVNLNAPDYEKMVCSLTLIIPIFLKAITN